MTNICIKILDHFTYWASIFFLLASSFPDEPMKYYFLAVALILGAIWYKVIEPLTNPSARPL